jgi:hypothetical protein
MVGLGERGERGRDGGLSRGWVDGGMLRRRRRRRWWCGVMWICIVGKTLVNELVIRVGTKHLYRPDKK